MGINAAVAIADTQLTDDHLTVLGLRPSSDRLPAEVVLATAADDRAVVIYEDGVTVIVDGGDSLANVVDGMDEEAIDLPGTVHFATAVSSVGFADYRVVREGRTIRRLTFDGGELSVDEGSPVVDESEFLIDGEEGRELDGDLLITDLPRVLGLASDLSDREGRAYLGADGDDRVDAGDSRESEARRKPGWFARLLGR